MAAVRNAIADRICGKFRVWLHSLTGGFALAVTVVSGASTSVEISSEEMARIYDEVKTPYKYGIVLAPERECEMVDNPCVFRHDGKWYMIYIRFDGKGYETRLAKSSDLLHWKRMDCILPRGAKGAWDASQADGWPSLLDEAWDGGNSLKKFDGRYWMMYLGGNTDGYEPDPLSTGVAWTDDPSAPRPWTRHAENPVLRPSDADAREFEKRTIYKHFTVEDPSRSCGGRFVNFYNAKHRLKPQFESIGMAVSDDMRHWRRVGNDAVIANGTPGKGFSISGDPMIRKLGDIWVMFYFGAGWRPNAFDTFACSRDLRHWTKWTGKNLIEPSEPWDAKYAHKPWVIKHGGVVYHFYCAVGNRGRAIALATSQKKDE